MRSADTRYPRDRSRRARRVWCFDSTRVGAGGPAVLWEGEVQGDGTGPQRSYYVRLYADSTGHCQCPAFYFRAVLKRNPAFACKHVIRARAAAARTG